MIRSIARCRKVRVCFPHLPLVSPTSLNRCLLALTCTASDCCPHTCSRHAVDTRQVGGVGSGREQPLPRRWRSRATSVRLRRGASSLSVHPCTRALTLVRALRRTAPPPPPRPTRSTASPPRASPQSSPACAPSPGIRTRRRPSSRPDWQRGGCCSSGWKAAGRAQRLDQRRRACRSTVRPFFRTHEREEADLKERGAQSDTLALATL